MQATSSIDCKSDSISLDVTGQPRVLYSRLADVEKYQQLHRILSCAAVSSRLKRSVPALHITAVKSTATTAFKVGSKGNKPHLTDSRS